MEQQPHFEGAPNTSERLGIEATNELQMALIEGSKLDPEEWIGMYSEAFREIIENDSAHFYLLYHSDPEACLQEIKVLLENRVLH